MADFKLSQGVVSNPPTLPLSGSELVFASQDMGEGWNTVVLRISDILSLAATPAQLDALALATSQALAGKSNTGHTHTIEQVTGLGSALAGKSDTGHVHAISGVTGLQDALNNKANSNHGHGNSYVLNGSTGNQLAMRWDGRILARVDNSEWALAREGNDVTFARVTATNGFNYVAGSALELKDIDGECPYGLAEIERMVTWIGRYKADFSDDNETQLFFDYDNLRELIPEAVAEEAVEYNGKRYGGVKPLVLLPAIVNSIGQLSLRQREEVAGLSATIERLERRLGELEGKG